MAKELVEEDDLFGSMTPILMTVFAVLAFVVLIPAIPAFRSANAYYSSQLFQGKNDPRILKAKGEIQWLFLDPAWVNAFFINKGPNNVYIGLNQRDNLFEMEPNETRTVTRTGAQERIHAIFYYCNRHETATIDVTGTY